MFIEVILEADIHCPYCAVVEKIVKRICSDLNIPFSVKYATPRSIASYEDTVVFHTYSRDWIERFGSNDQKKSLSKIAAILDLIQRRGLQSYPNLIIRWYDGVRFKEIVIRGYDAEKARDFARNLISLLRGLKRFV